MGVDRHDHNGGEVDSTTHLYGSGSTAACIFIDLRKAHDAIDRDRDRCMVIMKGYGRSQTENTQAHPVLLG